MGYLRRLFISLDQLANTVIGGMPDETISSRWGRTRKLNRVADLGCKILDKIDTDHCEMSVEFDKEGNPKALHLKK